MGNIVFLSMKLRVQESHEGAIGGLRRTRDGGGLGNVVPVLEIGSKLVNLP